jgi:oligopeptide/dipeptide ABC transporter ATP-binding protein
VAEPAVLAAPVVQDVLRVEDLHVSYPVRRGRGGPRRVLHAVDGVDLAVPSGSTVGLVGESGCGKTTLVKTILGLQPATSGRVLVEGEDMLTLRGRRLRQRRPSVQVVFQDPYTSLDPRMSVHELVAEPLRVQGRYRAGRVDELLDQVGLTPAQGRRRPGEFSGGQRQRIGIARALALEPRLLLLDEPVSALDKSIQAQVINLLARLQAELGLSYLFISHDLSVVRHVADTVHVMYLGRIVETGTARDIFADPRHPYTQALISAAPDARLGGRARRPRLDLQGDPPDPTDLPSGCPVRSRCPRAQDRCAVESPTLSTWRSGTHGAACLFAEAPVPS